MDKQLKKIVVIGPESTGKSTLTQLLAQHYKTEWCAEYAREYLTIHGKAYTFEDLLTIAKGQVELEERHTLSTVNRLPSTDIEAKPIVNDLRLTESGQRLTVNGQRSTASSPLLFIDTDMYVNMFLASVILIYMNRLRKGSTTYIFYATSTCLGCVMSCGNIPTKALVRNCMVFIRKYCKISPFLG